MVLSCCSHVDHLLSKLPKYHRNGFIEYLQLQGKLNSTSLNPYSLQNFNGWLQVKAQQQCLSNRLVQCYHLEKPLGNAKEKTLPKGKGQSVVVYHGAEPAQMSVSSNPTPSKNKKLFKVHCLFFDTKEHYISCCRNIK